MSTPTQDAPPKAAHGAAVAHGTVISTAFRVVIADDAAGIRALMKTLLSLEPDFDVVGMARNGAEAVEVVTALQPDLVVIDVSMPVMSGMEAIKAIREVSPRTIVVLLSGERHDLPDGADGQIEKGTPNDVLVTTLRELCRARVVARPSA